MFDTLPSRREQPAAALEHASIISFAVDRWDDVPRCRHHVMSRLARRNRVLFTSSPSYIRDILRRGAGDSNDNRVNQVAPTLYTYIPPRWLPYSYRFPRLNRSSLRLRCRMIARTARTLGMSDPILYIWHPSFADVLGHFDERLVVYHCYDEYSAFSGGDRVQIEDAELQLLDRADLVFTVSEGLYEKKRARNPNTYLVRNGVDYDLFAAAQDDATAVAEELQGIPRPIIGCVTRVVPEYFDAELLRAVFSARSDWSFVVVGPECSAADALDALKALPNVHFLGRRELADLPFFLKGFDACIIPYVLTENKRLADPLKLYEYLAAGKPIVSKPIPGLAAFGDVVAVASSASEWIDALDAAIHADLPELIDRRQAIARQNTWDDRVDVVGRLMARALVH
jgi:glycosyltransferase involved in cell wall biosynthesis